MTTHSFTSLNSFKTCAFRYGEVRVHKRVKEPAFVATELGKVLHSAFDRSITMGTSLPPELLRYQHNVDMARSLPGKKLTEMQLAVNARAEPCEYWDKGAMLRGSADFVHIDGDNALVADWKSGKVKIDHDQTHLLATMLFAKYPSIKTIKGVLVFVEHETLSTESYSSDKFVDMFQHWTAKATKVDKAVATNTFPPNPSGLCKNHCPVASCIHHGGN